MKYFQQKKRINELLYLFLQSYRVAQKVLNMLSLFIFDDIGVSCFLLLNYIHMSPINYFLPFSPLQKNADFKSYNIFISFFIFRIKNRPLKTYVFSPELCTHWCGLVYRMFLHHTEMPSSNLGLGMFVTLQFLGQ